MTGKKHDPNAELVGLGLGNIVAPFFGGIAATGALARTATNIRAGGTSPLASVIHALFVLAAILVAAPLVAYVPMAALAALLLLVAWNMSDVRHFAHTLRVAPRSDVAVLLTCFVLTVVFDMVIAIGVGVVLAALLFMKRMSELTSSRVFAPSDQGDQTRRCRPASACTRSPGPSSSAPRSARWGRSRPRVRARASSCLPWAPCRPSTRPAWSPSRAPLRGCGSQRSSSSSPARSPSRAAYSRRPTSKSLTSTSSWLTP
jgi:hypothetical protein